MMKLFIFIIMFSNGNMVVTPWLTEQQCNEVEATAKAMYQSMRFRNELPDSARTRCFPMEPQPEEDLLAPYHLNTD